LDIHVQPQGSKFSRIATNSRFYEECSTPKITPLSSHPRIKKEKKKEEGREEKRRRKKKEKGETDSVN
jgi:hypothetical protein